MRKMEAPAGNFYTLRIKESTNISSSSFVDIWWDDDATQLGRETPRLSQHLRGLATFGEVFSLPPDCWDGDGDDVFIDLRLFGYSPGSGAVET